MMLGHDLCTEIELMRLKKYILCTKCVCVCLISDPSFDFLGVPFDGDSVGLLVKALGQLSVRQ